MLVPSSLSVIVTGRNPLVTMWPCHVALPAYFRSATAVHQHSVYSTPFSCAISPDVQVWRKFRSPQLYSVRTKATVKSP